MDSGILVEISDSRVYCESAFVIAVYNRATHLLVDNKSCTCDKEVLGLPAFPGSD